MEQTKTKELKVIISGGGTGGHIFPALSIANAVKEIRPDAKILFVGAENRMEMQKVPEAGYEIIGLPVAGFDRKRMWRNFAVIIKLIKSQWKARKIVKSFKPNVAVGVGGYASGPTLKAASMAGIPTIIQEQNSYPGVTNKILAKSAKKICVAYEGMERFFNAEKIILTGNPVRQDLARETKTREEAIKTFGLEPNKKTILVLGGSLGAGTINNTILDHVLHRNSRDIQIIWQTGKYYIDNIRQKVGSSGDDHSNIHITDFIKDMATAYRAADLVISRAGAGSISEFCLLEKPVILVPSPNVSEDHQTKNALALVKKGAAVYVKDSESTKELMRVALETINDEQKLAQLSRNIKEMAMPNSAEIIAKEVIKAAMD